MAPNGTDAGRSKPPSSVGGSYVRPLVEAQGQNSAHRDTPFGETEIVATTSSRARADNAPRVTATY
jgi:hypothetical protein